MKDRNCQVSLKQMKQLSEVQSYENVAEELLPIRINR